MRTRLLSWLEGLAATQQEQQDNGSEEGPRAAAWPPCCCGRCRRRRHLGLEEDVRVRPPNFVLVTDDPCVLLVDWITKARDA